MTATAKQSAVLDSMVAQVLNRKKAPDAPERAQEPGKPAQGTLTPAQAEYFGSVAQARATVAQAVAELRSLSAAAADLARKLEYGHDLVLPDPAIALPPDPANARKAKEAEADARHRAPADEEAVAELVASAPPVLGRVEQQAASFSVVKATEGENPWGKHDDGKWYCPDHNQREIRASKKTGREYVGCPVPGCTNLERGL
jgi:hypothetical protein